MADLFQKILYYIDGSDNSFNSTDLVLELANAHSSTIIAINIIDIQTISYYAQFKNITNGEAEIELEENGWKYLYYFEELALDKNIKTFIQLDKGKPVDRILFFAEKYEVDLIVFPKSENVESGVKGIISKKHYDTLIDYSKVPILFV